MATSEIPDVKRLRKELGQIARAAEALRDTLAEVERARGDLDRRAFAAETALEASVGHLRTLARAKDLTAEAETWRAEATREVTAARDKAARRIPAALDELLAGRGLRVSGHVPRLRVSFLTVELDFAGKRPEARVQFGPGVATLRRAPIEPEPLAEAITSALDELEQGHTQAAGFLAELRTAAIAAGRRAELPAGAPLPLNDVLAELAWRRQSPGFRADPQRERFRSYGRVQFAYDLSRVLAEPEAREQVSLTIATREQTRRPEDSLWVPHAQRGDGTHFASLVLHDGEGAPA